MPRAPLDTEPTAIAARAAFFAAQRDIEMLSLKAAPADADDQGHVEAVAVVVDPLLLQGVAHPDEEQVRAGGGDVLEDRLDG